MVDLEQARAMTLTQNTRIGAICYNRFIAQAGGGNCGGSTTHILLANELPPPVNDARCKEYSLQDICQPEVLADIVHQQEILTKLLNVDELRNEACHIPPEKRVQRKSFLLR